MQDEEQQYKDDFRRLQEKLDIAQRQLYELENSRTLRTYHYARRSLFNPFWGIKNMRQIPGLLRKIEFPETFGEATSYRPSLPGDESGSFMPYPNLKIASIGVVPDMSVYCHHLITEGSEWHRLMELGIDALLVGGLEGYEKQQYEQTINKFAEADIPIFNLYPDTKLDGITAKNVKSYLAVDLSTYNPIGISPKQSSKPQGVYNQDKQKLYQYSAVSINPGEFENEYRHALAVLSSLSCGIPAITPKTETLAKLLPKDFYYADDQASVAKLVGIFNEDPFAWKRYSIKYRRYVHLNFSPRKLADEIASLVGFETIKYDPMVSVIISTNRPDYALAAIESVKAQQYQNKELLLVLHGSGLASASLNAAVKKLEFPVHVIKRPSSSIFGENLNIALDAASGEFITKMDDDDYYGEHHLEDLVAAYEYSRASAVGKRTNIVYLTNSDKVVTFSGQHEEKFSRHLPGATFLMRTEILKGLRFGRVKNAIDSELWRRLEVRGGTLYSTHDLNFIRVRHSYGHTYQTSDEDFIANSSTKPIDGLDKEYYFA